MATSNSQAYLIAGIIYLIISFLSLIFIATCIKFYSVKIFNKTNKYGSYIGISLLIAAIIRCLMDITMIVNSFHLDSFYYYLFESLELCQQLSYIMIILFVGGIYDQQRYNQASIKKRVIWISSIVCFIK